MLKLVVMCICNVGRMNKILSIHNSHTYLISFINVSNQNLKWKQKSRT